MNVRFANLCTFFHALHPPYKYNLPNLYVHDNIQLDIGQVDFLKTMFHKCGHLDAAVSMTFRMFWLVVKFILSTSDPHLSFQTSGIIG